MTGLGKPQIDALKEVLRQCTVNVRVDGRPTGTAFYIGSTLLLTCQHVVEGAAEVELVAMGRDGEGPPRRATPVVPNPGAELDLALLRADPPTDGRAQPAVLLDTAVEETDYLVAGFPAEIGDSVGYETFTVSAHERDAGTPLRVQLDDKRITYGMSGGPALSLETGAVVGVVQLTRDPDAADGGSAIAVARAAASYEEVRAAVDDPPVATRSWRDALGPEAWQRLGHVLAMETEIDLSISGGDSEWCIKSETTRPDGDRITASDLGDEVTEAMFRWAQRRRVSVHEEVNLLGSLLSKALFPAAVQSHLSVLSQADRVTVRLHVDRDTQLHPTIEHGTLLADIPWELACVPGRAGEFLAAHKAFRFVRVDDDAPRALPGSRGTGPTQVLGVIGLPPNWTYPIVSGAEKFHEWPRLSEISSRLQAHMRSPDYEYKAMVNQEPSDVLDEIGTGHHDVVHYVGVGRVSVSGQAQLSLVDTYEGDPYWQDANELLKTAAEGGVRLVVLEFTGPPADVRVDPVSMHSLGEILRGGLEAVVLTRFPVHPAQFNRFNEVFYKQLAQGDTVAGAVQQGRRKLCRTPVMEDYAAFGSFAVLTGRMSDVRLVQPKESSPTQRPAHQIGARDTGRADRDTGVRGGRSEFSR